MAPQTHSGSCHCGAIKYTCIVDLAGQTVRCNCTICAKTRSWEILSDPSDFSLTQGSSELTKYSYNTHAYPHYFCKHCGVQLYMTGVVPGLGEKVVVQTQTLDGVDARVLEECVGRVRFIDNLNDVPFQEPEFTKHL